MQLLRIFYSLYAADASCLQKILVAPDYACVSGVDYSVYHHVKIIVVNLSKIV